MDNIIVVIYTALHLWHSYSNKWQPIKSKKLSVIYIMAWTIGIGLMALWELKFDTVKDYLMLAVVFVHLIDVLFAESKRRK